jgi:hypothetical protein
MRVTVNMQRCYCRTAAASVSSASTQITHTTAAAAALVHVPMFHPAASATRT